MAEQGERAKQDQQQFVAVSDVSDDVHGMIGGCYLSRPAGSGLTDTAPQKMGASTLNQAEDFHRRCDRTECIEGDFDLFEHSVNVFVGHGFHLRTGVPSSAITTIFAPIKLLNQ